MTADCLTPPGLRISGIGHARYNRRPVTGPVMPPGIDIPHELGNRGAVRLEKILADVHTLQTFDHREPLLLLRCLSYWQHGAVSARVGHSRPTLDYKTFPGAFLRYTPGGHRRGDTHARGGRTPHSTGYARGSAHSEPPRRERRSLPRATWLLQAPAATARKSARIA